MEIEITSDDEERGFNSGDVDDLVRQLRYISRRFVVTVERIEIAIRNDRHQRVSLPPNAGVPVTKK